MFANFYRNSSLAILVYEIGDINTYDMLDNLVKELRINANPDVKVFLLGNKCELVYGQVFKEDAIKFKEANKIDYFI